MGKSRIGPRGGDSLVGKTHAILGRPPELLDSMGSFPFCDVIALAQFIFQPSKEPNLCISEQREKPKYILIREMERTKATPSRMYALLRPSISVSFLIDIIFSACDGSTVYRK